MSADRATIARRARRFVKVQLFNPDLIKPVADLFLQGAIAGWHKAQPFEAQIGFMTRNYVDLRLAGMPARPRIVALRQ